MHLYSEGVSGLSSHSIWGEAPAKEDKVHSTGLGLRFYMLQLAKLTKACAELIAITVAWIRNIFSGILNGLQLYLELGLKGQIKTFKEVFHFGEVE